MIEITFHFGPSLFENHTPELVISSNPGEDRHLIISDNRFGISHYRLISKEEIIIHSDDPGLTSNEESDGVNTSVISFLGQEDILDEGGELGD
jgi:hypothetical protein